MQLGRGFDLGAQVRRCAHKKPCSAVMADSNLRLRARLPGKSSDSNSAAIRAGAIPLRKRASGSGTKNLYFHLCEFTTWNQSWKWFGGNGLALRGMTEVATLRGMPSNKCEEFCNITRNYEFISAFCLPSGSYDCILRKARPMRVFSLSPALPVCGIRLPKKIASIPVRPQLRNVADRHPKA